MQYILHKDDLVKAEIFHGLAVDGTLNMKSFSWIGVKRRKPTTMCYAEEFRICFNVVMALYMVFGSISTSGQRVRTCKEEEEDEHIT